MRSWVGGEEAADRERVETGERDRRRRRGGRRAIEQPAEGIVGEVEPPPRDPAVESVRRRGGGAQPVARGVILALDLGGARRPEIAGRAQGVARRGVARHGGEMVGGVGEAALSPSGEAGDPPVAVGLGEAGGPRRVA